MTISKTIEEIWAMGTKKCIQCGKLKAIHAHHMCFQCYQENKKKKV